MIFPGLSGGSDKGYVKCLAKHLTFEKGYIVGVFHHRGVGKTEYTSPEFADLSKTEEFEKAFDFMVNKFKNRGEVHFVGVGLSMGGNVMMKMAGE